MLLGNNQPAHRNEPKKANDERIVGLISSGRYAEAYRLLRNAAGKEVPSLYNLALCLLYAGQYTQTITKLDEASAMLNAMGKTAPVEDDTARAIRIKQNRTDTYLTGLIAEDVDCFPDIIKDNITRIKVDCFLRMEQWNKVIELGTPLKNKEYRNIDDALSLARQRTA